MIDQLGRRIEYLRLSVTDRCNLRCVYCMPKEGAPLLPHSSLLSYEELVRVCRCASGLGIDRIKLTGGEPLLRRGIETLVAKLKALDGIRQVTLTTNAILLGELAQRLADAGLDRVNISLDTLDAAQYRQITRGGELSMVLDAILIAQKAGLALRLNCVPTPETLEQIVPLAKLAQRWPLDVRFIELMPIGAGAHWQGVFSSEVKRRLEQAYGPLHVCPQMQGNGPAEYASLEGFLGKIGFISAFSSCFCARCNRVRLTATGFLRLCLQYEDGVDLRELLRSGADDEQLIQAMRGAIAQKPAHHRFGEMLPQANRRGMSQIGG